MKLSNISFASLLILGMSCKGAPSLPLFKGAKETPNEIEAKSARSKLGIELQDQAVASSFPRLSHTQWENTVKDLLQLDKPSGLSANFPDDPSGSAYGNNGALYSVNSNQMAAYRDAAEALGEKIAKDPAAIRKLIPVGQSDAKSIVSSFLTKAYRRPPSTAEVDSVVKIFDKGTKIAGVSDPNGPGFAAMISTVLQSPNFIYRIELGEKGSGRYVALNPFEIASRLSYAIWNSMPDDALFALAKSSELAKPSVIQAQVQRLLDDPRASELLKSIHMKGYGIDQFKVVAQDTKTYSEASSLDTNAIRQESELFVEDVIVKSGKGITELFTAPYAFVSAKTAPIYDVSMAGPQPKKVNLDPEKRAGILSQVAFLSNFSKPGGLTAIIKRGVYVAETVLCASLKGAPPNVEDVVTGEFKTNREHVTALTGKGSCVGCHGPKIDPPGFALENFSPTGKWRTTELNGTALDVSGEYSFNSDSIRFNGPVELMKEIVKRPELHQCYAQKLVEGLYGRYADAGDAALIQKVSQASLQGASARELFRMVLTDPLMTLRSNE